MLRVCDTKRRSSSSVRVGVWVATVLEEVCQKQRKDADIDYLEGAKDIGWRSISPAHPVSASHQFCGKGSK